MHIRARIWALGALVAVAVTLVLLMALPSSAGRAGADHVRWDIIHLNAATTPPTISAGGHASASAPNGGDTITLTGSGTFVAPSSGGGSSAVTGGGTWTTSSDGSGTYTVTGLVSWVSAGPQSSSVAFNDTIDDGTRTNGVAVMTVAFSDGTTGVLTVGCEGPGAPHGIFEGIATTKGTTTYYIVQAPAAGVDANRTNFHVR